MSIDCPSISERGKRSLVCRCLWLVNVCEGIKLISRLARYLFLYHWISWTYLAFNRMSLQSLGKETADISSILSTTVLSTGQ